jgi:tRNA-2-methylthio-N6-dimethylallyladenosine synthase
MMKKYYLWTIGCQMNRAESERLASRLEAAGYQAAANEDEADTVILNTCVVRQSAENRVVNRLHKLKRRKSANPGVKIAVTGCFVEADTGRLRRDYPHVDYFFPPGANPPWLEPLPRQAGAPVAGPSVYLPIIQGCNNFCAYCIVPYRRGREKSRPPAEIIFEARDLVDRGAKEVVLLGQNVDSYGHDLPEKPELADLLKELDKIDGLSRLRFLTNHPKDISPALIEAMASRDKVCEQLSLPVQAGSDEILRKMKRGYTAAEYLDIVARLRRSVPGIALSTDVIVGFPSETASQFRETADLLKTVRFATVHVAAYSPRAGTSAARELADDVPPEEKKSRLAFIESLQETIAEQLNAGLRNETVEVLVQGKKEGKWWGRTRTDKLVFFRDARELTGSLVKVKINKTGPWSLQGDPVIESRREKVKC